VRLQKVVELIAVNGGSGGAGMKLELANGRRRKRSAIMLCCLQEAAGAERFK